MRRMRRASGFTLLEVLAVLAIVAVSTAVVSLALGNVSSDALAREGERLAALLEAARARSRTAGVPVSWRAVGAGFVFDGVPPGGAPLPQHWLDARVRALGNETLLLGPDPIIAAQAVVLELAADAGALRRIRIATDGLHPFAAQGVEVAP